MHARVTTLQMDPDRIEEVVRQLEERDAPRLREIKGFRGYTLLVDRASGRAISTSYWSSLEDIDASEEGGKVARERGAETGGAEAGEHQIERFEVAFDTFER